MILDENGLFIYKTHIIENSFYRKEWDKWNETIADVAAKIYSNLETINDLNNLELGLSLSPSSADFLAYSNEVSSILPSNKIKDSLLDEINFTITCLKFDNEKVEYLTRLQLDIVAIFMKFAPVLRTNTIYGTDSNYVDYESEWIRCNSADNRRKYHLHFFYIHLQKFLADLNFVREFILKQIELLKPLTVSKESSNNNQNSENDCFDSNAIFKEEDVTLKGIYKGLKHDSYRVVLMHRLGYLNSFIKENYNNTDKLDDKGKPRKFTELVMEEIEIKGTEPGFRRTLTKVTNNINELPRTEDYKAVVTKYAKIAVEAVISENETFFKGMTLNDIYYPEI